MMLDLLTEREARILQAVIRAYVESAEPAGSRTVVKKFRLGVSPATVRNTMADLEEKGYLYHPHTSAGRIPTDRAYRYYVDTLMRPVKLSPAQRRRLRRELVEVERAGTLALLIHRAAQVLGLLTGELGVAVAPRLDQAVLEKLELVSISSQKVLLVLTLRNGLVRTVYVDVPASVPPQALTSLTMVLNERLAGQTLEQIRQTLPDRLRDAAPDDTPDKDLLNIFLQSGDELLDWGGLGRDRVHLGRTSVLAKQPEFSSGSGLKSLIELTEQPDFLANVLGAREKEAPLKITIGAEHGHPRLSSFTLVTSQYEIGDLSGVIGVIGPTRMPYEKIVAIVDTTSALISELLGGSAAASAAGTGAGAVAGVDARAQVAGPSGMAGDGTS